MSVDSRIRACDLTDDAPKGMTIDGIVEGAPSKSVPSSVDLPVGEAMILEG